MENFMDGEALQATVHGVTKSESDTTETNAILRREAEELDVNLSL